MTDSQVIGFNLGNEFKGFLDQAFLGAAMVVVHEEEKCGRQAPTHQGHGHLLTRNSSHSTSYTLIFLT